MENKIANWCDMGKIPYSETLQIQKKLADKRKKGKINDTILLCEHHPIIHFSSNSLLNSFSKELFDEMKDVYESSNTSEEKIISYLNAKGIDYGRSTRGGGGAYIGPGQLVVYPIVDYEKIVGARHGIDRYKDLIDHVMKDVLDSYGIPAEIYRGSDHLDVPEERRDRKDLWIMKDGKPYKLGGKTIIISDNIAYHGFCFYREDEGITGFRYVDPCGHTSDELGVTSVEACIGDEVSPLNFRNTVLSILGKKFGYSSLDETGKDNLYRFMD